MHFVYINVHDFINCISYLWLDVCCAFAVPHSSEYIHFSELSDKWTIPLSPLKFAQVRVYYMFLLFLGRSSKWQTGNFCHRLNQPIRTGFYGIYFRQAHWMEFGTPGTFRESTSNKNQTRILMSLHTPQRPVGQMLKPDLLDQDPDCCVVCPFTLTLIFWIYEKAEELTVRDGALQGCWRVFVDNRRRIWRRKSEHASGELEDLGNFRALLLCLVPEQAVAASERCEKGARKKWR